MDFDKNTVTHNGNLQIATGFSAGSKVWKNKKMLFSDFVKKLSEENKTNETFKEFINASKTEQGKIKDVGGYVGAYLRNGKRSPQNVVHRQLITLDIDFAHRYFWDDYCLQYNNAAVIHATHKHSPSEPRYRLIMPISREVTCDEYVAIARQIAGTLGIDAFDNTTFEVNRLMFWPSNPKDVDYYFRFQDGPWIDADAVLASYADWTDTSLWPTAGKKLQEIGEASKKQEDPKEKKGLIGAFCRTFTISEAIGELLKDTYTWAGDDRYTYAHGTTAAGLITYDDLFAYSHHGTDPCSGKLCNAFDLVRIHLFGHLDSGEDVADSTKLKSYAAMQDFTRKNIRVKQTMAKENISSARYDFQDYDYEEVTDELDATEIEEQDIDWMTDLEADAKGNYMSTAINLNIIFNNDPRLKGKFRYNEFDAKRYVFGNLPWRRVKQAEPLKDVDYSGIRNYIESIYGIAGTLKIDDALALEFQRQSYHPVKEYLEALKWDRKPRINKLLVEYFGAEDNAYTHEAIRKMLLGGVARIYRPGCKFDYVLTIIGPQGTKKSTFIKKLGKLWASDSFTTVHGKESFEQIQGKWLLEIAELAALQKADIEAVKHYISKQEDSFRLAYGRTVETFLRQCIFFASTNKKDFLRDPSGNRRFLPIDVRAAFVKKDVFTDLDGDVDQIWAEAVYLYKDGEQLHLSDEAEKIAKNEQMQHSEVDERRGLLEQYFERALPSDWDELDIYGRRNFLEDPLSSKGKSIREVVCIAEIWCECLGREKKDMTRYNTRELNDIMRSLEDWEEHKSTKNFKLYGKQKYYTRKLDNLY